MKNKKYYSINNLPFCPWKKTNKKAHMIYLIEIIFAAIKDDIFLYEMQKKLQHLCEFDWFECDWIESIKCFSQVFQIKHAYILYVNLLELVFAFPYISFIRSAVNFRSK